MRLRPLAALAMAAGLSACGPRPIVLRPQGVAGPAPAGTDGRYRGTARLIRAEDRSCPRSGPRLLEIAGGSITLSYSGDTPRSRIPLTSSIGADGRIQASDGIGVMEGELRDGQLGVTISSRTCEHRWTMVKG